MEKTKDEMLKIICDKYNLPQEKSEINIDPDRMNKLFFFLNKYLEDILWNYAKIYNDIEYVKFTTQWNYNKIDDKDLQKFTNYVKSKFYNAIDIYDLDLSERLYNTDYILDKITDEIVNARDRKEVAFILSNYIEELLIKYNSVIVFDTFPCTDKSWYREILSKDREVVNKLLKEIIFDIDKY